MSKICEQAMKAWVQIVDENICDLRSVENRTFNYDDEGYKPCCGTECNGAYWALRAVIRDERAYIETYKRMEEYFHTRCMSIIAAFYSISDEGYQD